MSSPTPTQLAIHLPGAPIGQGRGRIIRIAGQPRIADPARSRSWKGAAQVHYQEALARAGVSAPFVPEGPVSLDIVAVFACPKSAPKRISGARRPQAGRPDADNIAKACMDAANGLLFMDDAQVAQLRVWKLYGIAGEAPFVRVTVRPMDVAMSSDAKPAIVETKSLFEETRA